MKIINEYFEKDIAEDFYQDEIDDMNASQLRRSFENNNDGDYFKDLIDDWFESKTYN